MRFGTAASGQPELTLSESRLYSCIALAVFASVLIAGTFARTSGLGARPLAVDEYYFIRSVTFLLETGLPEFPSGGYYTRGLLPQYLTALSILIFGETGFAFRLPTTLFGFLAVGLGYAYCRRHLDRRLAVAVACALLVSSWQVEYARFARMYAFFQCFTLILLIAFDEAYFRNRRNYRYAPHVAGIALILSHSLSILFTPLLLIPLIDPRMRARFASGLERLRFALAGLAIMAFAAFMAMANLRNLGVLDRFPLDYVAGPSGPRIIVPAFPFWQIGGSATTTLLAVIATICASTALVVLWARRRNRAMDGRAVSLVVFVLSAMLHQFMVAGLFLWALVCRYDAWRIARQPKTVYLAVIIAAAFLAGWMGYSLSRPSGLANVDGSGMGLVWSLRRTFFGWPDFYTLTLLPWMLDLPWMGVLILASLIYLSFRTLREPNDTLLRRPWVLLAYVMVCFGILRADYSELRYWYFIYPVILCVIATGFQDLANRLVNGATDTTASRRGGWIAVIAFLAAFGLSGDFQPRHLAVIASHDVTFRTGPYHNRGAIWYDRKDYASPARYIERVLAKVPESGATRVIVTAAEPASFYLGREHAVYLDRGAGTFTLVSRERGTRELWSNRRLLNQPRDVERYTETAREVWLIRPAAPKKRPFTVDEVWGGKVRSETVHCAGIDGRIEVVQIKLSGPEQAIRRAEGARVPRCAP